MKTAERYEKVVARFKQEMPTPTTELNYENPYQLLVAVILSAQCTDKRINLVTPHSSRPSPPLRPWPKLPPNRFSTR